MDSQSADMCGNTDRVLKVLLLVTVTVLHLYGTLCSAQWLITAVQIPVPSSLKAPCQPITKKSFVGAKKSEDIPLTIQCSLFLLNTLVDQ